MNNKNFSKSNRPPPADARTRAKELATDALIHIASDPEELARFLKETGFDPLDLRRTAEEPSFAGIMLDYLCSNEGLLVAFARQQGFDPSAIDAVRQSLASPHNRES